MPIHTFRHRIVVAFLVALVFAGPVVADDDLAKPAPGADIPGEGPVGGGSDLWLRLRKAWARRAEAGADKGAIAFLGDSITQGWSPNFWGHFKGFKTANRGISGDTTRGNLYRVDKDVLAIDPAAIVILIGVNDIAVGVEPEVAAGNVKLLLEKIKAHSETIPIILCTVMPSAPSRNISIEKVKKLNATYAEMAKDDEQITLVDTWKVFANADGHIISGVVKDGIHPNMRGYERWAGALRPVFVELGLKEPESEESSK